MVFGNRTLTRHLLRGAIGFSCVAVSLHTMNQMLWPSLVLLPIALYALRGCPICWTVGLVETIVMRIHGMRDRANAEQKTFLVPHSLQPR